MIQPLGHLQAGSGQGHGDGLLCGWGQQISSPGGQRLDPASEPHCGVCQGRIGGSQQILCRHADVLGDRFS